MQLRFFLPLILAATICGGTIRPSCGATPFVSTLGKDSVVVELPAGWTLANQVKKGNAYLLQFVPPGEDVKNVKRLVNVTTYLGMQKRTTAFEFMTDNKKRMIKMMKKPECLEWKTVTQDNPNDVLFEYTIKNQPGVEDQYEVQRVVAGKEGLHAIIYHLKTTQVSDKERREMAEFVKKVKVTEAASAQ